MRKIIVEIKPSVTEQEIEWFEEEPLDADSLFDFWIYPIITDPEYSWRVVDEEGNDVTDEYRR